MASPFTPRGRGDELLGVTARRFFYRILIATRHLGRFGSNNKSTKTASATSTDLAAAEKTDVETAAETLHYRKMTAVSATLPPNRHGGVARICSCQRAGIYHAGN